MLQRTENRIRSLIYEELATSRARDKHKYEHEKELKEQYDDARALRAQEREADRQREALAEAVNARRTLIDDLYRALRVTRDEQLRFDMETELAELLLGKPDDGN